MFQHGFNTLLYLMIGYALLTVSVIVFWGSRALRFRYPEVTADNLESTIRGWLCDSGLSAKRVSNPAWIFGLQTTLPVGESMYISQMKEHRHFIALEASLTLSPEHQAILKAVPRAYLEKLMQEVVLKVFLAEMGLTIRMRLSDISFSSKFAITRGSMKDEFFEHLGNMDNAIILARDTIAHAVERAQRLVDRRNIRIAKASPLRRSYICVRSRIVRPLWRKRRQLSR